MLRDRKSEAEKYDFKTILSHSFEGAGYKHLAPSILRLKGLQAGFYGLYMVLLYMEITCVHDFPGRFRKCVHFADPFHRMFGFELFRHTLPLCNLSY